MESTLVHELCVQEKAVNNNIVSILYPHFLIVNRIKTGKVHKTAKKYWSITAEKNMSVFDLEVMILYCNKICTYWICRWKHLLNNTYPQMIRCSFEFSTIIFIYRNAGQWKAEFSTQ